MAEIETRQAKGRYRKVEVRTWGDEKFRRLSPMPPCGQGLWLFLITGPHTGPIPGLFRAGRAAMAEELDWDVEAFDKAFGEAFREGMVKADFKARVVWVPKAINHNRPESPNVVLSWAAEFDLIPECPLKWEALDYLRASVYGLGEAFTKAFDKAFGKPSGKPSPKAMPNQEQEQEQEKEPPHTPPATAEGAKPGRRKREKVTFAAFLDACQAAGESAIPKTDPIFTFAKDTGIPKDYLHLAWREFAGRHKDSGRMQKDWRAHFRDAVRRNWFKLWWFPDAGSCELTTAGVQLARERDAERAREQEQAA
ncbi:hypothetical protein ATCM_03775 [Stenotrophomonas sp. ATCM1_4]|uniref:hypothetical protein n=1 Tax=Stenotrophomonas sp. ATCM1_4 TaxID=2259330 RepID=UPI001045C387|nr:hypothetical protein [Stenotrophomonas sp. ATCM1_4]TDB26835.1 hypothetical protein ATCM_03775 [Stenotrophomonas sp. ATCM1_4]